MSEFPCTNPNCPSYGQPHPNCKCGQPSSYADGGLVPADDLPDELQSNASMKVPLEDLPDELQPSMNEKVPLDDLPDEMVTNQEKYGTPTQQAITGLEGVGEGVLGPTEAILAKVGQYLPAESGVPNFQKTMGFTPEDIAGRAEVNPGTHAAGEIPAVIASSIAGIGLPGLASKIGTIAKGSAFMRSAIANGILTGGDEISKGLLGQGDPTNAVGAALANTLSSSLWGGMIGKAASGASQKLESLAENKAGTKLTDFVHGLGAAGDKTPIPEGASQAYKNGDKAYSLIQRGANLGGLVAGGIHGYAESGLTGIISKALSGAGESEVVNHLAAPAIARIISNGMIDKVGDVLNYANNINSGLQKTTRAVNDLFGKGGAQVIEDTNAGKKVKDWIKNGGIQQHLEDTKRGMHQLKEGEVENEIPGFAEGGQVDKQDVSREDESPLKENGLAKHLPEHHIAIEAGKTRIHNYLKSLEPHTLNAKLPYDDHLDNKDAERKFNRATNLAAAPLSILSEIKNGTILPEHVQHFQAMHPEVNSLLQKELTQKIAETQLKGEKPSYKIRQGLSLFLGSPLSSELTPQNIQAAQSVFNQQNAQPQVPKRNNNELKEVDDSYLTGMQARAERKQRKG